MPFRIAGDAAFFQRPEVRDALAWLRMLADPNDCGRGGPRADEAPGRPAIGRPRAGHDDRAPAQARHGRGARGLAREPAAAARGARPDPVLPEAPALGGDGDGGDAPGRLRPPPDRARRACGGTGCSRPRPETAERLVNLSRLAELAADFSRRVPRGSVRDFVRHIAAVAEAGERRRRGGRPAAARLGDRRGAGPGQGPRVRLRLPARPARGVDAGRAVGGPLGSGGARDRPAAATRGGAGRDPPAAPRLPGDQPGRARRGALVAGGAGSRERRAGRPFYETVRAALDAPEEVHDEEVFGPAEGLHSTYRMIRDEVLEASWRAGSAVSEMRLDTAEDVNRAVARYLELIKLAALLQQPGLGGGARRRLAAVNELLGTGRLARAAGRARDLGARRVHPRRGARARRASGADLDPARALARAVHPASRGRPRALGLGPRPLPDLPAEVQVRPRLRDPAGADDQPALRDPDPQRPRALPLGGDARGRGRRGARRRRPRRQPRPPALAVRGGLAPHRVRRLRRRAAVSRPRGRGPRPLPRAPHRGRLQAGLARAELLVRDRPAPAARPGRPRRPARGRRATS